MSNPELTQIELSSSPTTKLLRYASDLHLEFRIDVDHPKLIPFWDFKRGNEEYFLALVGDIGNPFNPTLKSFFEKVSPVYKKVFFVAGNHEYYNYRVNPNKSKDEFDAEIEKICAEFPNILFLNNKIFDLDGIKIIGSTLWSNIPKHLANQINDTINDYHLIKKRTRNGLISISTDDSNKWNKESVEFITKEINSADAPCILLTHYAPLFSEEKTKQYTAPPEYLNGVNNYAFHNDLSALIKSPIVAWIYGHTHYSGSFKRNGVLIATNQLGYSEEEYKINFYSYAAIDLDRLLVENL